MATATKSKKAPKSFRFPKTERARTKSEIVSQLAEQAGVARKDVNTVLEGLASMIGQDVKKGGPQTFNMPGLFKITVQKKPATKARKGINPFTGEETMFKAKPARNVVKIRPLKGLKDMAS